MKETSLFSALAGLALASLPLAGARAEPLLMGADSQTSRLFTNDFLGDHRDRWRTSSYSISFLRAGPGDVVNELRFRGENIAGSDIDLKYGAVPDRPAAGLLGFGVYRSDRVGKYDYRIGGEITIAGPKTGVVDFQKSAHDLLGMHPPSQAFIDGQIGDQAWISANAEIGRDIMIGDDMSLRPWVGATSGVETMARAGADLVWGGGAGRFGVRDEVTGWRKPVGLSSGASFLAGVDFAKVYHTELLESGAAEDTRTRVRVGFLGEDGEASIFYGLAYLSEEFRGQESGQVVGAITISLGF